MLVCRFFSVMILSGFDLKVCNSGLIEFLEIILFSRRDCIELISFSCLLNKTRIYLSILNIFILMASFTTQNHCQMSQIILRECLELFCSSFMFLNTFIDSLLNANIDIYLNSINRGISCSLLYILSNQFSTQQTLSSQSLLHHATHTHTHTNRHLVKCLQKSKIKQVTVLFIKGVIV